jgi:hypothetical protein
VARKRISAARAASRWGVNETPIDMFVGEVNGKQKKRFKKAADLLASAKEEGSTLWFEDAGAMQPRHFVGVYAVLHRETYGVDPLELTQSRHYAAAVRHAKRLLDVDFGGDAFKFASFLNWTWARERKREKRSNGDRDGHRLTWQIQFASRAMLADYRAACLRNDRTTRRATK